MIHFTNEGEKHDSFYKYKIFIFNTYILNHPYFLRRHTTIQKMS